MPSEHTICVVLSDDLEKQLREVAEEDTVPMSAIVRQALKLFFVSRKAKTISVEGEAS